MRRPSRRAVLGAALGVGLGTASGCLGTTGDPSTGVEPVSLGTEQALDGRSVVVSDVPGVFRGVFSVAGTSGSYALELPIRPGETDNWRHTFRRVPTGWTGDVQFVLDSVADGRQVLASTTVETETDAESRTERDSSGTDSPTSTAE